MIAKWANWIGYGFQTFVLRRQIPYLYGMVITDRCNLNCFYCKSNNTGRFHFSWEQACASLRDAYGRGHRTLYFTGGEPMIWEDDGHHLSDLVSYSRQIGFFDVFIFTNGTRPLDIRGCNYIVSLDGPRDVHNRIRANTYDQILSNVANAATRAVFASITFSKATVDCLERFVRETHATGLFRGISFNLLTHWPEILAIHGVSPSERLQLLDDLWRFKQAGFPIVLSCAAYHALRNNDWKRPIPQIELGTRDGVFTCCRDIDNPAICKNCGYVNCAEVSQMLALKPSALWQMLRTVR